MSDRLTPEQTLRAALSWIEDTPHGERLRKRAVLVLESIIGQLGEGVNTISLLQADVNRLTTELERVRAHRDQLAPAYRRPDGWCLACNERQATTTVEGMLLCEACRDAGQKELGS